MTSSLHVFWLKLLYTSHTCILSLSLLPWIKHSNTFVEAYKQIPDCVRFSSFQTHTIFYAQMSPLVYTFLGALVKVRRGATSFVMAVYTSVRPLAWNNWGRSVRIFMKFDVWVIVENLSGKSKFHYNPTRITGILQEDQYTFLIVSRSILLGIRIFQRKVVEKIKIHVLHSNHFFIPKSCRLWVNVEKYRRAGQATWQYGACALHTG